jgi:hypothetical protein
MFKLRQEYAVRVVGKLGVSKTADSLVSLMLGEGEGEVSQGHVE